MSEAALVFALTFGSAFLAFLVFEADAWVRKQRRYRARYEAPEMTPRPYYAAAYEIGPRRVQFRTTFDSNPATFQHFAADSADERIQWGPA